MTAKPGETETERAKHTTGSAQQESVNNLQEVENSHPESEDDQLDSGNEEFDDANPITEHATILSDRALVFSQTKAYTSKIFVSPKEDPENHIYECTSNSAWGLGKPKMSITSDGQVVAHVYHRWSSSIKVGIDLSRSGNESNMEWVELEKQGLTALTRRYNINWRGKAYVLTRMRGGSLGLTGMKKLLRHMKFVEAGSDDAIATFVAEAPGGKLAGTLTLKQDVDKELELLIVASVAGWREMSKRQQRSVAAAIA